MIRCVGIAWRAKRTGCDTARGWFTFATLPIEPRALAQMYLPHLYPRTSRYT
ncbi:hypothetical protein BD413DRAFT_551942 [Trametes elegans]|nr:hypothetical protein BD413DRAFT_551942 [Trametes elegans]